MKIEEAHVGQRVRYVPYHAFGHAKHPDCEDGVVVSKNDRNVFVRFNPNHTYGIACAPETLIEITQQ